MKPEVRRELLGYVGALAFLVVAAIAIRLITSSLATLGIDWYWWLGFGLFLLPFVRPCARRRASGPSPRERDRRGTSQSPRADRGRPEEVRGEEGCRVSDCESTAEQKLYRKLFEVAKAAQPVDKAGHNSEDDYDFARYEDVLAEASKRLEEQGIHIVPQVASEELKFSRNGFAIATAVMEFDVVDTETGFSITRRWSGTGHDEPGDKALYAAETGCEKYFLARLLRIPFGTDPEEDGDAAEAERVRREQDSAAEAPQDPPASLGEELDASAAVGVS